MRTVNTTWTGEQDLYLLLDNTDEFTQQCINNGVRFSAGEWYGDLDNTSAIHYLHRGDDKLVAPSDAMVEALEGTAIHTQKWRNVDDVAGSIPNVPAYLAGHPCAMRRRTRLDQDDAPIAVFIDLDSSAGISAKDVLRRGTAALALTRLLSDHRPVELWAGIAMNVGYGSSTIAWRIDTAPLDLARAAFALCSPAVSRGLGYKLSHAVHGSTGGWPFDNYSKHRNSGQERLERVFGQKVLYIPGVYLTDELITNPTAWIKRELEKYTHKEEQ